ncbi:ROK family protein [Nocardioides sp.]|uniref:ROK family protein n=1 Tax=Nocardioides sp. TaxID=35761 RepID=UPI003D09F0E3
MSPTKRVGTGTNQEDVRRHNLGTLLRHVHRAGHLSRAELTTQMALNRSTIGALVSELEALGITEQTQRAAGGRQAAGRPSAEVRPGANGPYVVAVDVGVDRVKVARVGLGGRIHQRAMVPIIDGPAVEQVEREVVRLIREVVSEVPGSAPLVGIGVSVPGLVRRTDGLVRIAPNLGWHDVPFASLVRERLGLSIPVVIGNDADLGALSEHERGAGVGVADLIYVSGNVGVGAGVIAGGIPLGGAAGYAGEVGHLPYDAEGPMCHCGNRGCWETEIGAVAIAQAINCPSERVPGLGEVLDGFPAATPELRVIGAHLGRGLANLVNVLNPEVIVLGGYLGSLYPLVSDEVKAALAERALQAPSESVTLSLPGLGSDSVLLGAGEIAFDPLFVDPVASLSHALIDVGSTLATLAV